MTTVKNVSSLLILLSVVALFLGIYYQSLITIAVPMIVIVCLWVLNGFIKSHQQQKPEDDSLSGDEDLVFQEKEGLDAIHEPIVFPSEISQIINEFIKENTSESAPIGPNYLTMIVINKARSLNNEDAVETVLIEIIKTLNNEILQMRTEKINLLKNLKEIQSNTLGEGIKRYKNLKVLNFNNTK